MYDDEKKVLQIIPAPDHLYAGFGDEKNNKIFIAMNKVVCFALIETTSGVGGTRRVLDAIVTDETGYLGFCKADDDFLGFRIYPDEYALNFKMRFSDGRTEFEIPKRNDTDDSTDQS